MRRIAAAILVILAASVVVAGCNNSVVVTPPPGSVDTGTGLTTEVPIGATPWPNGTTGAYGLRIDPSLSNNLPAYVGGNPLVEDAGTEVLALGDRRYAEVFEAYYVAQVGSITDLNWVQVTVARLKGAAIGPDFYASWREDWFDSACSQAGGIGSTSKETINDWQVDLATCTGGVRAYTLSLSDGILVSIVDLGPRRLGRQLIEAIN